MMTLKNPSAGDILHYMGKGFKVTKVEPLPQKRFLMDERGLRLEFIKQRKEFIMETTAQEKRILKHLELSNEIENMGKVIHMLKKLILEITGEAPADEVKSEVAPPQPSLSDLLNGGPERLIRYRKEAVEKIGTIEELIF